MSSSEEFSSIAAIVERVLRISSHEAASARRGDQVEWNSLKHIEIVFQVEEAFDVQFAEDEIGTLVDVKTIAAAVDRARGI